MQQLPQQLPGYFTVGETISGVQFPMLWWDLGVFASVGCTWAAMGSLWGAQGGHGVPVGCTLGGHRVPVGCTWAAMGSRWGACGRPWGPCGVHMGGHGGLWGAHGRPWFPCGVRTRVPTGSLWGAHGRPWGPRGGAHGRPWYPCGVHMGAHNEYNNIPSPPHLHPKTCFNVCLTTEIQTKLGLQNLMMVRFPMKCRL